MSFILKGDGSKKVEWDFFFLSSLLHRADFSHISVLHFCSFSWWKCRGKCRGLGFGGVIQKKSGGENIQDAWIRVHVEAFNFEKIISEVVVVSDR